MENVSKNTKPQIVILSKAKDLRQVNKIRICQDVHRVASSPSLKMTKQK